MVELPVETPCRTAMLSVEGWGMSSVQWHSDGSLMVTHTDKQIHLFIHSFFFTSPVIYPLNHLIIDPFNIHSFNHSFIHANIYSFTHPFTGTGAMAMNYTVDTDTATIFERDPGSHTQPILPSHTSSSHALSTHPISIQQQANLSTNLINMHSSTFTTPLVRISSN